MIVLATIPVGLVGLVFEHEFRVLFGKPIRAAIFLVINGLILLAGELFRRKASVQADREIAHERELVAVGGPRRAGGGPAPSGHHAEREAEYRWASSRTGGWPGRATSALVIGTAQILALLAGISRDGVAMVAGMMRGLSREDAARFAFLLATPVILAAGLLKVPDLMGPLGNGIRGQPLSAGHPANRAHGPAGQRVLADQAVPWPAPTLRPAA